MMQFLNINMKTVVSRLDLLDALRRNRAEHAGIVAEARRGYVAKAKEALNQRLAALESGKLAGLSFSLTPPKDYTHIYDTAIKMLEMSLDQTVELKGDEFRKLVEDKWEWSADFYASNSNYSQLALDKSDPTNTVNE